MNPSPNPLTRLLKECQEKGSFSLHEDASLNVLFPGPVKETSDRPEQLLRGSIFSKNACFRAPRKRQKQIWSSKPRMILIVMVPYHETYLKDLTEWNGTIKQPPLSRVVSLSIVWIRPSIANVRNKIPTLTTPPSIHTLKSYNHVYTPSGDTYARNPSAGLQKVPS